MSLGSAYEEEAITALANSAATPRAAPPAKFSAWRTITAPVRGVVEAAAQVAASAAEAIGGFGQVLGAYPEAFGYSPTGEARKQADAARQKLLTEGVSLNNDVGDALRESGRSYRPDPMTAHAAEQIVYGFARGATKVVGGAMLGGPIGVVGAGLEEGMSAADDLRAQGVGFGARTAAGAVQGAGLALAALPAVGQTTAATAGLFAVGGPGGFIAQQAATRAILENAGYDQIAAQYDPFDPVGLTVATLLPAGFAVYGLRQQKLQRAVQTATLPEPAAPVVEAPAPIPSRETPIAAAARAYPTEAVDAARVVLLAERRAAANPGTPDNLRAMDQHEAALTRAEDQINAGEAVQVADVAPAAMPSQAFGRVVVDPTTLVFRESEQARLDQVREDFPGDEYHPVVLIVGENGKRSILDGHNRAVIAEERGHSLPAVEISDAEYTALHGAGFDDMEIAFAALMRAGERDAADALNQQFGGSRVAARGDDALDVLREQLPAAPYQAWAGQITAAIRDLQTRTDAPTTPQAPNPEAAAPARGAGGPPADAGAADAGRPATGVEAVGLTPEQASAAVEAAKADVIALRKRESVLNSLLECLTNG